MEYLSELLLAIAGQTEVKEMKIFLLVLSFLLTVTVGAFKYLSRQKQILNAQLELNQLFVTAQNTDSAIFKEMLEHQKQSSNALVSLLEKDNRINKAQLLKIDRFFELSRHAIEDFFFRTMEKIEVLSLEDMQEAFDSFFKAHEQELKNDLSEFEFEGKNIGDYFLTCKEEVEYIKSYLIRKATVKDRTEVVVFLKRRYSMIKTNLINWTKDQLGHDQRGLIDDKD